MHKNTAIMIMHGEAAFALGLIQSKEKIYYGTQSFITPLDWPWNEDIDRYTMNASIFNF